MQRCGAILALCAVLGTGQTCPAANTPTAPVRAREPDLPRRPPSPIGETRCDRAKRRSGAETVGAEPLPSTPHAASLPHAAPHEISVNREEISTKTSDVTGTASLDVRGWLQTNALLFLDARPNEPADALAPSGFSMGAGTQGRHRFRISARDSRFTVDARSAKPTGRWRAVAEFDFFGRSARSYDPRVRLAYVEWTHADGSWGITAGQDWSLFADPSSFAALYNPLPAGAVFVRQPQVRVTHRSADGLSLAASIERARGDIASSGGSILDSPVDQTPDLVTSARLDRPWGALQWGGLLRDGTPDHEPGWGLSASGTIFLPTPPRSTALRFQATYGLGIARYIGEFGSSYERDVADAARATEVDPRAERIVAANLSCEHAFTRWLSGTILGSVARAEARDVPALGTRTVRTLGGNAVFHPSERTDVALEYLAMSRRDGSRPVERRNVVRLSFRLRF